jgi:AraC-like DNA-binding protein
MSFIEGLLQTIILLGAAQGFILSCLLFFSTNHRRPNRLLAVLIFLIALASLRLYGLEKNWFHGSVFASIVDAFVPMIVLMPIGPLLFFYVKTSLNPQYTLTLKDRLQFFPAIFDLVPQITAAIFVTGVLMYQLPNKPARWAAFIDNYNVYSDILRWFTLSLYVWLTIRYLAGIKRMRSAPLAYTPDLLQWLQLFIRVFAAFQIIWLLYLIPYVIPRYSNKLQDLLHWYPVYVPLAILIYWLGIKGYLISHQPLFSQRSTETMQAIPSDIMEQAVSALTKAMVTDKLYLNPDLTVSVLAEQTTLPAKTISAVLNQHFHKNFNEFINAYRVDAIREKMQQEAYGNQTIASLAYDCGFNSLSTFQRSFKLITGITPREYMLKKNPQKQSQ